MANNDEAGGSGGKKFWELSQELEECKTQLRAAIAAMQEQKKPPDGNILKNDGYHIMCGMAAGLTTDVADESGENPEDSMLCDS